MKCLLLLILCVLKIGFVFSIEQDSMPTLSRVYGDYFIAGVYQNPTFSQVDYDAYLAQINQIPINTVQGNIDFSFGAPTNYPGAQVPCNGFFGAFLQQKVKDIRELSSGNFLVGMDGKLDSSNHVNMMLTQLTPDGLVDNNFGNHGFINLPLHQSNENLISVVQDFYDDIYVVGYSNAGSIVRKYNATGAEVWVADNYVFGSYVTDIALQGTSRLLVAHQLSSQQGQLAAYNLTTGEIDMTFCSTGASPGVIDSPDFGVTIGQLYGVIVSSQENIFIAYQNNITGHVDLAALYGDGRSLIPYFASTSMNPGVAYNVFSSVANIDNVRLALDNYNNIIIAASTGTDIILARFDGQTGNYDYHFNGTGIVTIPSVGHDVTIQKIVGLTDGSIMLAGYDQADDTMLAMKITIAGQLDTNFDAQGTSPGMIHFKIGDQQSDYYARCVTGLSIQSSTGDLILGGYQQRTASDAIPMVMRLYGMFGVTEIENDVWINMIPGTLDSTINDLFIGQKNLSAIIGWEELLGYTAYAICANNDGTMYIAFGNGQNCIIGLVDANMYPVTTFGNNGLTISQTMTKIYSLIVDSQGRIIISGIDNGVQKIIRYVASGILDTVFSSIMPAMVGTVIAEQRSGTIVVAGYLDTKGIVCGYQNNGEKLVASFGPWPSQGYYLTDIDAKIDDIVIDDVDAIYLVYRNSMNHVCLEKLMPNGSYKVTAFNNGHAIDSGLVATTGSHIAINSDKNILVGSYTDQGIQFCLYDGLTGTALTAVQTIPLTDNCIVTKIVGAGTDFIGSGFSKQDEIAIAFRVEGSTGMLDAEFGSLQNGVAVIQSTLALYGVSVQLDGRIVMVGANGSLPVLARLHGKSYIDQYPQMPGRSGAGTFDTTLFYTQEAIYPASKYRNTSDQPNVPSLIRLHGDAYVNQYPQMPGKSPVGTIDTTLFYTPPADKIKSRDTTGTLDSSFGVFNFNSLSSGDFNLAGFTIKHLYTYSTGLMLFVCDNGIDTIIFRVLNNVSLDTIAHGGSGFNEAMTPGYIKIAGYANPTGLYVDEDGKIFIAGGSTISWARAYNSDGSIVSGWVNPVNNLLQGAYEVGVQSCGRRVVAGFGASYGVLYGYTPSGDLDAGFGINGVVSTGLASPIADMSIDSSDHIIIGSVVDGHSVIQRVSPQGITMTTLSSGTAISSITGNQLKVALDEIGNIVVAAATTTGFTLQRYDSSGANSPATPVTIIAGGSGTSRIGNLYVTSDNKVGLVGYETTTNNIVCARLHASFALDTSFNGGVALITTDSPMDIMHDATVYVDNRIIVVGGGSITPDPYMARIFGDDYVTVMPQSPLQAVSCTNDFSFGSSISNGIIFHALTGDATQHQVAQAIALQDEQNIVVALDGQSTVNTDNRIFINMFNTDGDEQTNFGVGGKVEILHTYGHEYVRDMVTFTQAGIYKAILAGYVTNSSASITNSLLLQYNLSASNLDASFGGFDGNPQGFVSGQGQKFYTVAQQSNGRIIAGGLDKDGSGLLVGYTPQGKLDRSFASGGIIRQGTTGIYTHVVDSQNRIIIAYNDGNDRVAVARFVAHGSLDTSFNSTGITPGVISTNDMISGIVGNNNFRVAIDQLGKIVVASVHNSGLDFVVKRYTQDGVIDTDCTISSTMLGGTTSLTIAKLLIDEQGTIAIVGYDTALAGQIIVMHLRADLSGLDSSAHSSGRLGYVKYAIASGATQIITDALIHQDGRILVVGSES
ncbi:MAG: hypothetical protein Q8Q60_05145 [Candidatus Chromulinivorax sp.]|nr:hypothetical protein [Candidatus Chromulinivorax sp.]